MHTRAHCRSSQPQREIVSLDRAASPNWLHLMDADEHGIGPNCKRLQPLSNGCADPRGRPRWVEAAKAETTLAQVINLEARTAAPIGAYAARRDATDAAELEQMQQFIGGLSRIAHTTAGSRPRAASGADARAAEAAEAERRRAAVEDRLPAVPTSASAREAADRRRTRRAAAAAKGPVGTALEERLFNHTCCCPRSPQSLAKETQSMTVPAAAPAPPNDPCANGGAARACGPASSAARPGR